MAMRHALWLALGACGSAAGTQRDAAGDRDGSFDSQGFPATLDGDRDRLLATYLVVLQGTPTVTQSNGLRGVDLHSVCELWTALAPSPRLTFLTITHRLYGSVLAGGSRALDHVTKLYRAVGGQDASASSNGSCGGGEYNRLIMQMDIVLHDAQVAANTRQGSMPYDVADVIAAGYWRDSHDLGGSHAPFDLSDETNDGAPRGQTQYFRDPTSTLANTALGRLDLGTLVDPLALEMDQDYDCVHASNPSCDYTAYGPLCALETTEPGTAIYTMKYGDFGAAWRPAGC